MTMTTHRPLFAAVRRNLRSMMVGSAKSYWILGLLLAATVLILTAPTRTIQMQARTLSAEVQLTAEPLAWDLTGAKICRQTLNLDALPVEPCGAGEEFAGTLDGPITWPRGQRLNLTWRTSGVRIQIFTDGPELSSGTVLLVGSDELARNGALAFLGYLSIGQEMSPGANGYVLDGSYAIFEQGLVSGWLGWSPDVTRQGHIRRGDQLQIICSDSLLLDCVGDPIAGRSGEFRNPVSASISIDHDGNVGIHVIATGAEANSKLEVIYAGLDTVLLIETSWVQRAAASSSLLVLSLLFSLLAPILLPMLERTNREN